MKTITLVTRWCTLSERLGRFNSHNKQRPHGALTSVTQKLYNAMKSISHSHKVKVFSFRGLNVIFPQISSELLSLLLCLFIVRLQIGAGLVAYISRNQFRDIDIDNAK